MQETGLVDQIPEAADIVFASIRSVLRDLACLDENRRLKKDFLIEAACSRRIYDPEAKVLASPRQLFTLDIETGDVAQLTDSGCSFTRGQVVDSTTIMASAACSDTNDDGLVGDGDHEDLYLLDLATDEMDCLTCELGLTAINNADYSTATGKVVFSAQRASKFHNYLFALDLNNDLVQLTNEDHMDFDCSWSEDGTMIVFSRLPKQDYPWTVPSQVWLMDSDGANQRKITDGGPNPSDEEPHGPYPIGIDADPDLSPDNRRVVVSRLKTGSLNEPFGVYELIVIDLDTKETTVLDSSHANMIPEWKSGGIIFIRQTGSTSALKRKQGLWIYRDGEYEELETYPYNVFPIGAHGANWIE